MPTRPQQFDEVHRLLDAYLHRKGLRKTPERFWILEALYAADEHLDAHELSRRLEEKGLRVSRATVYNTLELLQECGLVVRHQFGENQARYERAHGYRQHDHLICTDCHAVFEFCDPRLQGIRETMGELFHLDVRHHELQFYGRCVRENCPNRAEAGESG